MKKILYLALLIVSISNAQENKVVSFLSVEQVPIYPGCEGDEEQLKKCFTKKVNYFFSRAIARVLDIENLEKGNNKIYLSFTVNQSGKVTGIQVKAHNNKIKKDAVRILEKLPQMKPGKQNDLPVSVKYLLPFKIKQSNTLKTNIIDLAKVDEIPLFNDCNNKETVLKECFYKTLKDFITSNFDEEFRKKHRLFRRKYKVKLYFQINNQGDVQNIVVNTKNKILVKEFTRILEMLPKKSPALLNGDPVSTFAFIDYTLLKKTK